MGRCDSPQTAEADISSRARWDSGRREIVVRILERASGQVMLVSACTRPCTCQSTPMAMLRHCAATGREWVLNFETSAGGSKVLAKVDSSCQPPIEFVSQDEAVVNTCIFQNGRALDRAVDRRPKTLGSNIAANPDLAAFGNVARRLAAGAGDA